MRLKRNDFRIRGIGYTNDQHVRQRVHVRLRRANGYARVSCYPIKPAALRVWYAPRFFIVLRPFAETLTVIFLPSSGMKRVLRCRLIWRRRLPVGLNLVARVRLEYPPPTRDFLPVMSHTRAIVRRY